jgi:hypothetical protein
MAFDYDRQATDMPFSAGSMPIAAIDSWVARQDATDQSEHIALGTNFVGATIQPP